MNTTSEQQDSRLAAVLRTIVDGMVIIDEQGIVESFNPAAEQIFGYRADEVVGRNVKMLMPEPDRSRHDDYLRRYRETGEARIVGIGREVVGRRKDGSTFPLDLAVSEAWVEGHRIFAGLVRDITERRRSERERERLIAELEQKNEELERFTYTVSHDLRTPLTPIIGFAELLREQFGEAVGAAGLDMLGEIEQQAERMLDLIDDLLDLSRAGYLEPPEEAVEASEVLDEVLADLETEIARENVAVHRHSLPEARLPRTLIRQILDNLVGNAVRHAGGEGGPVEIGGERSGRKIRLWVRDHGPGIPEQERSRIFEIFFRGSGTGKGSGTGVGLSTVRKIALSYGGRAWVEETPGGGSTFRVELIEGGPSCAWDDGAAPRS